MPIANTVSAATRRVALATASLAGLALAIAGPAAADDDDRRKTRVTFACSAKCPSIDAVSSTVLAGGPDDPRLLRAEATARAMSTRLFRAPRPAPAPLVAAESATTVDPVTLLYLQYFGPILLDLRAEQGATAG